MRTSGRFPLGKLSSPTPGVIPWVQGCAARVGNWVPRCDWPTFPRSPDPHHPRRKSIARIVFSLPPLPLPDPRGHIARVSRPPVACLRGSRAACFYDRSGDPHLR
jgi:hypothetical protein